MKDKLLENFHYILDDINYYKEKELRYGLCTHISFPNDEIPIIICKNMIKLFEHFGEIRGFIHIDFWFQRSLDFNDHYKPRFKFLEEFKKFLEELTEEEIQKIIKQ